MAMAMVMPIKRLMSKERVRATQKKVIITRSIKAKTPISHRQQQQYQQQVNNNRCYMCGHSLLTLVSIFDVNVTKYSIWIAVNRVYLHIKVLGQNRMSLVRLDRLLGTIARNHSILTKNSRTRTRERVRTWCACVVICVLF